MSRSTSNLNGSFRNSGQIVRRKDSEKQRVFVKLEESAEKTQQRLLNQSCYEPLKDSLKNNPNINSSNKPSYSQLAKLKEKENSSSLLANLKSSEKQQSNNQKLNCSASSVNPNKEVQFEKLKQKKNMGSIIPNKKSVISQNSTISKQDQTINIFKQFEKILPNEYKKKLDVNRNREQIKSSSNLMKYLQPSTNTNSNVNTLSSEIKDKVPYFPLNKREAFSNMSTIKMSSRAFQQDQKSFPDSFQSSAMQSGVIQSARTNSSNDFHIVNPKNDQTRNIFDECLDRDSQMLELLEDTRTQIKQMTQSLLFFLSFYKDIESVTNDFQTQQQDMRIYVRECLKKYAVSQIQVNPDKLLECQQKLNVALNSFKDDIGHFKQQIEIHGRNKMATDLKESKKIICDLLNENLKLRNKINDHYKLYEDFQAKKLSPLLQKGTFQRECCNTPAQSSTHLNKIVRELQQLTEEYQLQIKDKNQQIDQQNDLLTQIRKELNENKAIVGSQKYTIQQLLEQQQESKDPIRINPKEHEEILLENNRFKEQIQTLEDVNQELTQILNKDERFKQLKSVLTNLNNILISKKTIDVSPSQVAFIKILINESQKIEIEELKKQNKAKTKQIHLFISELENSLQQNPFALTSLSPLIDNFKDKLDLSSLNQKSITILNQKSKKDNSILKVQEMEELEKDISAIIPQNSLDQSQFDKSLHSAVKNNMKNVESNSIVQLNLSMKTSRVNSCSKLMNYNYEVSPLSIRRPFHQAVSPLVKDVQTKKSTQSRMRKKILHLVIQTRNNTFIEKGKYATERRNRKIVPVETVQLAHSYINPQEIER